MFDLRDSLCEYGNVTCHISEIVIMKWSPICGFLPLNFVVSTAKGMQMHILFSEIAAHRMGISQNPHWDLSILFPIAQTMSRSNVFALRMGTCKSLVGRCITDQYSLRLGVQVSNVKGPKAAGLAVYQGPQLSVLCHLGYFFLIYPMIWCVRTYSIYLVINIYWPYSISNLLSDVLSINIAVKFLSKFVLIDVHSIAVALCQKHPVQGPWE